MNEASINTEQLIEEIPKDLFQDSEQPHQEVARISVMLKEGVQAEEIVLINQIKQNSKFYSNHRSGNYSS